MNEGTVEQRKIILISLPFAVPGIKVIALNVREISFFARPETTCHAMFVAFI